MPGPREGAVGRPYGMVTAWSVFFKTFSGANCVNCVWCRIMPFKCYLYLSFSGVFTNARARQRACGVRALATVYCVKIYTVYAV